MKIRSTLITASALLATAASAQTDEFGNHLYGQLTQGLVSQNHQSGGGRLTKMANSPLASSLFGLRGSEDLGAGWRALYRLESAINPESGNVGATVAGTSRVFNRQAYAGLDFGPVGQFTLGRQFHVSTDRVINSLDPYFVAGTLLAVTPLGLYGVNRFAGNDSRVDNAVKYRVKGPAGLEAAVSYGFDNAGPGSTSSTGSSHAFDLARVASDYTVSLYGVRFDAPTVVAATGRRPSHQLFGLGGNTDLGPAKLYLHYLSSTLDATTASGLQQSNKILALGAQWRPIPQVSAKIAYYDDRGQSLNGVSGRDGHKKTLVLSAEYYLSRRTSLFAVGFNNRFSGGYVLDPVNIAALGRDAAASSTTGWSVGLRHNF